MAAQRRISNNYQFQIRELVSHKFEIITNFKLIIRHWTFDIINWKFPEGFSLIEVIVVIALFAITSIVVTTSYIGFEGRERLKNAALQLKGDIRFVQSKAQSGDKGLAPSTCATTSSLVGWYVTFSLSGTTYTYAGDCLTGTAADANFADVVPKLPSGVTISSLKYNGADVGGGVLTILFRPIDYAVVFYDSSAAPPVPPPDFTDTAGFLKTGLTGGTDEAIINLHNSDGDYQVKVNRSGEVHEVRI